MMDDDEMDQMMDEMDRLVGSNDIAMNVPVQEAKVPDHFKDIDPKEFKEGGRYYFPNNDEDSGARDENCFESICLCCCIKIHILQFIVIVSLIEIVVFIISCSIMGLSNQAFLAPNPHALEAMGWQDCKKIKNDWQIWRWITPVFLHGHLEHLVGNVVIQLFLGTGIEYGTGFLKMTFLYLLSGFGGNLLSACIAPAQYGVGASTAVFGLVGFLWSYFFTNFFYMGRKTPGQRWYIVSIAGLLVLMNLNLGPNADSHVDNWGHLGGLISGIFIGIALTEKFDYDARAAGRTPDRFTEEDYKEQSACRKSCPYNWCGCTLLVLWFLTLLIVFYVFTDTDNLDQGDIDDP